MLIRSKPGYSPLQRSQRKLDADNQWRLQRGIARAALEAKAEGRQAVDAGGRPLYYANGAARFGYKELEQRLKGRSVRSILLPDISAPSRSGVKRYVAARGGRWERME